MLGGVGGWGGVKWEGGMVLVGGVGGKASKAMGVLRVGSGGEGILSY